MRRILVLLCCAAGAPLAAQDASPYVPLSHWTQPLLEHLIARGKLRDPTPLTRPLRAADVIRAIDAADSSALTRAEWASALTIRRALARRVEGYGARVDLHLGAAARSHARRDALRAAGPGHGTVAGGAAVALHLGPLVAVSHPYFDTRLKWDPDYRGKQDRVIAGRNAEAYLSAQLGERTAELFFGSLDRNWGPPALEGLLVSPSPYSYEHFGVGIGTPAGGIRLEGLITQLDDFTDTAGTPHHRYLVAHRLILRPGRTTISLWEGTLLAGPDRQLEPWFANVLTLGLLTQYDQTTAGNSLVGADVATAIGGARLFASVLLDDIQIDDDTPGDGEPPAYGLTLGAQGALGPAAWTASYTRVSNLAYRTPNFAETWLLRGVGLARNFSDYDQLSVSASLLPAGGSLLTAHAVLLRQGAGDFRLPYPPESEYPTTPAFLDGVVERTVRLGVGGQVSRGALTLAGDGGVHVVRNAGHVSGARETRWVGRLELTVRYRNEVTVP